MEKCLLNNYIKAIDFIHEENGRYITNNFFNFNEIKDILNKKDCFFYDFCSTFFLIIPYHNVYYDLIYYSKGKEYLYKDILYFINNYDYEYPVRASIIGKEPVTGNISELFEKSGFKLVKKLGRVVFDSVKNDNVVSFVNSFSDIQGNYEESINVKDEKNAMIPVFAKPSDADNILEMLLEEFDMCGENVPELNEIIENIKKNQVAIIKKDNLIIAVNYFNIKNKIRFCIYEYVRKEFRKNSPMFILNNFIDKYIDKNGGIRRSYGWRDVSKKRLIRVYQSLGERFDGVYIYNHVFKKNG